MDLDRFLQGQFDGHMAAAEATRAAVAADFPRMVRVCVDAVRAGGKLMLFGNGGSASDAQHLATEFTVRYILDRDPIPAIALHTDTSFLTATGNDLSFDQIFSRQIEALGKPGDVAIAISTSGKSPNVIKGLEMARDKGLKTVGLSGKDGGAMVGLADPLLIVPAWETARIQEMHITVGHALCAAIEIELGLAEER